MPKEALLGVALLFVKFRLRISHDAASAQQRLAFSSSGQKRHHLSGDARNLWYGKLASKTFANLFSL
jgi:hypothetical protein